MDIIPELQQPGASSSSPSFEQIPILGQAVGVYRERTVSPLLQRHFSHIWFHALPSGAARRTAIVPDGCADLIWASGALRIAGPDRVAKIEQIVPGSTVIGMRFKPGAMATWLRLPAADLVGARTRIEQFWGEEARRMADWISEGRSVGEVAARLEAALERRAATMELGDDLAGPLFRLVADHDPLDGHLVDSLMERTGMSERTLRRRYHDAFGYGPKTLGRILRFQRFMQLVRRADAPGLAAVAAEAGYADQAHLTRETRELTGFTPSTILTQLTA